MPRGLFQARMAPIGHEVSKQSSSFSCLLWVLSSHTWAVLWREDPSRWLHGLLPGLQLETSNWCCPCWQFVVPVFFPAQAFPWTPGSKCWFHISTLSQSFLELNSGYYSTSKPLLLQSSQSQLVAPQFFPLLRLKTLIPPFLLNSTFNPLAALLTGCSFGNASWVWPFSLLPPWSRHHHLSPMLL